MKRSSGRLRTLAAQFITPSITLTSPNEAFSLALVGKNLTDKSFVELIYDTPLDTGGQSQFFPSTAARQFGATVEYRF